MTFKSALAAIVRKDSVNWVESLLREHGVPYSLTQSDMPEMNAENAGIWYETPVRVYRKSENSITCAQLVVDGCVLSDGIFQYGVRRIDSENDRPHIWFTSEYNREECEIEKFNPFGE